MFKRLPTRRLVRPALSPQILPLPSPFTSLTPHLTSNVPLSLLYSFSCPCFSLSLRSHYYVLYIHSTARKAETFYIPVPILCAHRGTRIQQQHLFNGTEERQQIRLRFQCTIFRKSLPETKMRRLPSAFHRR